MEHGAQGLPRITWLQWDNILRPLTSLTITCRIPLPGEAYGPFNYLSTTPARSDAWGYFLATTVRFLLSRRNHIQGGASPSQSLGRKLHQPQQDSCAPALRWETQRPGPRALSAPAPAGSGRAARRRKSRENWSAPYTGDTGSPNKPLLLLTQKSPQ